MRLPALLLLLSASPALAQPVTDCLVEAYAGRPGIVVRAAPFPDAPALLRLPDPLVVGDGVVGVSLTVTGFAPGWFRIEEAGFSDEVGFVDGPRRVPLDGPGWVPAQALRTTIAAIELRAAPREDAPVSARLMGIQRQPGPAFTLFGPEGVGLDRLAGCRGAWLEVETPLGRGWTDRVCARQRSGCE
jgi:hypothetical protein